MSVKLTRHLSVLKIDSAPDTPFFLRDAYCKALRCYWATSTCLINSWSELFIFLILIEKEFSIEAKASSIIFPAVLGIPGLPHILLRYVPPLLGKVNPSLQVP